jgi:pimeloyl-ACP methyl ester carboxylesterase
VNTGNVEIAALFAPKPLAMSAANDWTKDLMTKGYPELTELYKLYGAESNVSAKAWLEYGHQYNQHAREFMYAWFSKHLLGKDGPVKELPYKPLTAKELTVFDDAHPRPKGELNAEQLREKMAAASDVQLAKLIPADAAGLKEFKRVVGTALRVMVNDQLPDTIEIRNGPTEAMLDGLIVRAAAVGRPDEGDVVPGAGLLSEKYERGGPVVVWVHPKGKASLSENGKANPAARALADAGFAVFAPDVLGVGDLAPAKPFPVDKGFAAYTFGYNRTPLANQVHDLLTLIAVARVRLKAKAIHLVGWGEMGPAVVLAKALVGDAVAKTAADLNQFRFENIKGTADPMMLPGAVKYGGLGAFLGLCAPGEVLAHNHAGTASGKWARAAYAAAGADNKLTRSDAKLDPMKVVEWLVK